MLVNQGLTVFRLTDATPYRSEVQQPALATAADVHTRTELHRLTANRVGPTVRVRRGRRCRRIRLYQGVCTRAAE
jgi:hypothetical protein